MLLQKRRWVRSAVSVAVTMVTAVSVYGAATGPAAAASGSAAHSAPVRRAVPAGQAAAHFTPPTLTKGKPRGPLAEPNRTVTGPRAKPVTVKGAFHVKAGSAKAAAPHSPAPANAAAADDSGSGCTAGIGSAASTVGQDVYLEETVTVGYQSDVSCTAPVDFEAEAFLIDRSPDFNGQTFDGNDISDGNLISADGDTSSGTLASGARSYDGARAVESAIEVVATLTDGSVWADCTAEPGTELLYCAGVGTDTLDVVYGAGTQNTGMTAACRDFNVTGDTEQARVNTVDSATGTPYSTEILNGIPEIRDQLVAFRQGLCGQTGAAADFAQQSGLALWNAAVAAAHNGEAGGDDRPLYWARLGISLALAQWKPAFTPDTAAAQHQLEPASRGMLSATFTSSGPRVLISGFDPFGLDTACGGQSILNANPSAEAVLRLDGDNSLTGPGGTVSAEVHAVIFPVRYADFDNGLVENFFEPYLDPSSGQLVNIVNTVSDGGDQNQFKLEYYNGRNRSTGPGFGDNECATSGDPNAPTPPASVGPGPQFTETTLPVDSIAAANPALAAPNYLVKEIRNTAQGSMPPVYNPTGPTVAATAVEGSGGGFLSNEIAYRVTLLRDALNSPVLAGHIHTPLRTVVDPTVAQVYENLLASAVQAPPVVRVRVTTNQTVYNVGDTPVYTVTGPPNTKILWSSSLNGVETGENDSDYGLSTDSTGSLTVAGGAWTSADIGSWVKQVRLGNVVATVAFQVQ